MDGTDDGPRPGVPLGCRLRSLRRRPRHWRDLTNSPVEESGRPTRQQLAAREQWHGGRGTDGCTGGSIGVRRCRLPPRGLVAASDSPCSPFGLAPERGLTRRRWPGSSIVPHRYSHLVCTCRRPSSSLGRRSLGPTLRLISRRWCCPTSRRRTCQCRATTAHARAGGSTSVTHADHRLLIVCVRFCCSSSLQ